VAVLEKENQINKAIEEYYEDGKLLRLGVHQLSKLEKFPMVFGANIASKQTEQLLKKLTEIDEAVEKLSSTNDKLSHTIDELRVYKHMSEERATLTSEISNLQKEHSSQKGGLETQIKNQGLIQQQLDKARSNNWLSNLMQGLNVQRLIDELKDLENKTNSIKDVINKLEIDIQKAKEELSALEKEFIDRHPNFSESSYNPDELISQYEENLNKIDGLKSEKRSIQEQIDQITKLLLNRASVVATTLTKCYLRTEMLAQQFDVVIVDEISMAQIPHLFVAIGLAKKAILVGDFLQLPPISQADTQMAKKWLSKNLYDYFEIPEEFLEKGTYREQVKPLFKQYRMHPDISYLINNVVYKGHLEDDEVTKTKRESHKDFAPFKGHIAFLDTQDTDSYCRKKEGGSRYTLKTAFIDLYLASFTVEDYLRNKPESDFQDDVEIVGIVTPYRAQASLIAKLLAGIEIQIGEKSYELGEFTEVNTVHKFQGNQRSVIIFDSTDDYPMFKPSQLVDDDEKNGDDVKLINVAVTRAKDKFLLLGNKRFIENKHSDTSLIKGMVPSIEEKSAKLKFEGYVEQKDDVAFDISSFLFPAQVIELLNFSTSSLHIVVSDLFTNSFFSKVNTIVSTLLAKGVNITITTQLPDQYSEDYSKLAADTIGFLKEKGFRVNLRTKFRDSFIITDQERVLCFIGENESLGIQVKSSKGAKELINLFNLEDEQEVTPCPECQKNGRAGMIVPKMSRYGVFYSCSLWPKCKYIDKSRGKDTKKQSQEELDKDCPRCGKKLVGKRGRFGSFIGCSGYPDCKYTKK